MTTTTRSTIITERLDPHNGYGDYELERLALAWATAHGLIDATVVIVHDAVVTQ